MRLALSMQHNSHRLGPFPQSREDGVMGGLNFEQPSARENPSPSKKAGPPANGKKTKGRVKIKMEFIDNKLRRYTTFSKRKTGIMKKAYELSTLTGTQVMLLVASETGHVYTFATRKLQPMITSEAGKALIQTCLNSPDPPPGPGASGLDQRMSATGFEETDLTYSVGDDCEKVLDTVRPPDSPLLTPSAPATPPAVTLASSVTNAGFAAILAPGNMVIPAQGLGSGAGTVVYHQSSTTASPGLVYASGPSALSEGLILNLGHEQHGGTPQQFITIPVSLSLTPAQQQQLMQGTQTMASTPSCTEMNLPHSQPKREKLRK